MMLCCVSKHAKHDEGPLNYEGIRTAWQQLVKNVRVEYEEAS